MTSALEKTLHDIKQIILTDY